MTDAASHGSREARHQRALGDLTAREREALYRFYTLKQRSSQISRELEISESELRELKSRVKREFLAGTRSQ